MLILFALLKNNSIFVLTFLAKIIKTITMSNFMTQLIIFLFLTLSEIFL